LDQNGGLHNIEGQLGNSAPEIEDNGCGWIEKIC